MKLSRGEGRGGAGGVGWGAGLEQHVLYYTTMLYYVAPLHYTTLLYSVVLHYTTLLYCAVMHYTTLLYCAVLHYTKMLYSRKCTFPSNTTHEDCRSHSANLDEAPKNTFPRL